MPSKKEIEDQKNHISLAKMLFDYHTAYIKRHKELWAKGLPDDEEVLRLQQLAREAQEQLDNAQAKLREEMEEQ